MLAREWQVSRAGRVCGGCGREFAVGERFRACLYEGDEGYARCDYCSECAVPEQPPALGTWLTRRPAEAPKRTHVFDPAAILQIFERLQDDPAVERQQFRFVLALLLWRKKVLKLERTRPAPEASDAEELWEFRQTGADAVHAVARPGLGEDELERLSEQLETLLADAAAGE
jgi:hypothetical protein